jgi:hypothetical protein
MEDLAEYVDPLEIEDLAEYVDPLEIEDLAEYVEPLEIGSLCAYRLCEVRATGCKPGLRPGTEAKAKPPNVMPTPKTVSARPTKNSGAEDSFFLISTEPPAMAPTPKTVKRTPKNACPFGSLLLTGSPAQYA